MKPTETLRDRNRLVRVLAAAGLAVISLRSLRKGKRLRGALAGLGAVGLGYSASGRSEDLTDALETDEFDSDVLGSDTDEAGSAGVEPTDDRMRCPVCGEPIVAGERRKPNAEGETAHEACLEATA